MSVVNKPNVPYPFLIPSHTKVAKEYIFDPSVKEITIFDNDLLKVVAVTNITRGVLLYAPTRVGGGIISNGGKTITVETDTSEMSSSDALIILYEYSVPDMHEVAQEVLDELKEIKKYLRKIYE